MTATPEAGRPAEEPSSPARPIGASGDQGEPRRLVRTIVCAYSRDELPTSWLQVFRRFDRAVARAGLRIRVRLLPLEELPEGFEVLVVAPQLRQRAEALPTDARIVCTTRELAAVAVDELLRELEGGRSIYAERADPNEPRIVVHRGSEVL